MRHASTVARALYFKKRGPNGKTSSTRNFRSLREPAHERNTRRHHGGGRGERLKDLTEHRCKPATPFGGKFRIIDFVLSNCVNSGIRQITVLTQYKAQSLIQHIQRGWGYLRGEFGEFVEVDSRAAADRRATGIAARPTPCTRTSMSCMPHRPQHVLVLAGDHIYKMDYGPMIAYHVEKGADITVGVVEVPRRTTRASSAC